ncbi:nose resistant to fluoxetine protein 6-like isoform X2 [Maniola jurtina]|uniref:nose resistant to fluoxetine protein 6-like isoform X2 n=1 Tax=Maniola jurtina TaxID=191418 RepID=UPI001E68CCC8|nr:nose resistant to fluoxetine protein 6-like isoform X2 [Maniola jurtina]
MVRVIPVLCLLTVLAGSGAVGITEEQYYSMPRLFELDDYEECLATRGAFCLGSFHLTSKRYSRLLDAIQKFSDDKNHFNHTYIQRGYCVTTTCAHIDGDSPPHIFEECVHNLTKTNYGLDTELIELEYCKTEETPPKPIDVPDMIFAVIVGLIVMGNVVGTAYDLLRNPDNKPNRYLMTWSARVNWGRLTANYEKEDPRLCALDPVNGMKAITLIAVIIAHSSIAHYMTFVHNPSFLETAHQHPLSAMLTNGTAVVQTFIILSSFLLAYNVLLTLEANPNKKIGLAFWWQVIMHRVVRITPLSMFVVGLTATWWRHMSDGPLWSTLVQAESDRCRNKWWTHAFYVNNLVMPDERCLIQTWFLAVDMQLYLVTSVLLVLLIRRPHTAVKVFSALFVLSILANFAITYNWDLTILFLGNPELIRWQYKGVPSFKWQYAAPWSSAPAAILGLLLAFVYHLMRKSEYDLHKNTWFRILYRMSVPAMFLWILGGFLMKDCQDKFLVTLFSTLERPVFGVIVSIAMIGFFYRLDRIWWWILSWRSWQILGRMSLSMLLIHWTYNLSLLAVKTNLARTSFFEIGGHSLASIFMTYVTSLPLHIFVELPTHKFLQTIFM